MYDENICKLFVGNIPYNCTEIDFNKCFKNIDGFIEGCIVKKKNNTDFSRGFGFVTMKTSYNADKLKNRKDIKLKDRYLRFTTYNNNNNNNNIVSNINNFNIRKKNYLFVDCIPSYYDRYKLKEIFADYEPIGKYFINTYHDTGQLKNNGIIEVLDNKIYYNLINKKYIKYNDVVLQVSKWKYIFNKKYID